MRYLSQALGFVAIVACSARVDAGNVIEITATPTGGGPAITSTGTHFLPQLRSLIQTQGAFAPLSGQSFNATVRYGDVNNAMHISENAAGTSATLSSQLSSLSQQFVANNSAGLRSHLDNFIQKGSDAYSAYVNAIDNASVFGVIDGNPLSATAFLGQDAYFRWGQDASTEGTSLLGDNLNLRIDASAGGVSTRGYSGNYWTGAMGFDWQFSKPVGIALSVPFEYRELAGTNTYISGLNLGIPITLIQMGWDGWGWRVTPFGSSWGAFSGSLAAGGFFVNGGVVSSLRFRSGPFQATLIDQVSYSGGIPITVANISYQTDVDQWLFKNGVQIAYAITQPVQLDASVAYSNYTHKAAIPDWWTVQAGLNFRFTNESGVRVAYEGNFGPGYCSNGGTVSLYLRF